MKTRRLIGIMSVLGFGYICVLARHLPSVRITLALHLHNVGLTDANALIAEAERMIAQNEDPVEKINLWIQLADVYHQCGEQGREQAVLAQATEYCDAKRQQITDAPRSPLEQEAQKNANVFLALEKLQAQLHSSQQPVSTDPSPVDSRASESDQYSNRHGYSGVALSAAIRTLLQEGKTELAIKQASMEATGTNRGQLLMAMGWQQVGRGDYTGARQLYLRARATTFGDETLDLFTLAGIGDYQGCVRAYKDADKFSETPGSFTSSLITENYAAIAALFAKSGNLAALQALNQFDNLNHNLDTSPQIVTILLNKGDFNGALKTAHQEKKSDEVRQELLGQIAVAYARKGDFPAAVNLALTLQQPDAAMQELHYAEGGGLTPFYRDITLKDIATLQAAVAPDAALQIMGKIHAPEVLNDALALVAAVLAQNGHKDRAIKGIEDVAGNRKEVRRAGMMGLARSLAQAKDGGDQVLALAERESPYIRASLLMVLATEMRRHK